MTTQQTIPLDFMIMKGLGQVVMWLAFVVFHLAVAVVGLFLLWWYRVPPERVAELLDSIPAASSFQWFSAMGGSALTILALDCWCWRKIYIKLTTLYIFRDAKRAMGLA